MDIDAAFITGANRGIGLELVRFLAANEFAHQKATRVLAACRCPEERAEELQNLAHQYPNIEIIKLDVEDWSSIETAAKKADELCGKGGLNLLVNNAGVNPMDSLKSGFHFQPSDMELAVRINTLGPIQMTKALLPVLRRSAKMTSNGKTIVVNISSTAGSIKHVASNYKLGNLIPYRVSKAGLNMASACMAEELRADGIICFSLHPGWVRTDMGGQKAPLSVQESVASCLKVIKNLTIQDTGSFLSYDGEVLPW
uniref:C-factor n=1 Tax=Eptatretus burgeri TaxID=7764 RepID=A0A8C4WW44_EPTBU